MARWRKEPYETGLARVCQNPPGYEFREGDKVLIHVSCTNRRGNEWYWYGCGRNTLAEGTTFISKQAAKVNASEYYQEWKKKNAI